MRAFGALWDEITRERYGVRTRAAPVPLRRAGQLARAHRGAAGEQRPAHRARDAGGHAVARRAGPRDPAPRPGTRRSACRGRGTSSGRCACSRCSPTRPTCWSTTTSSTARGWSRRKVAELVAEARAEIDRVQEHGRRGRGRRVRLHEGAARRVAGRAAAPHRVRRDRRGRGQPLHETEPSPLQAEGAAAIETVDPAVEAAAIDGDPGVEGRPRRRGGRGRARRAARRGQDGRQPHAGHDRLRAGGRHDRRVGGRAARGVRRVPRAHRGVGRGVGRAGDARSWPPCASACAATGDELGTRLRMLVGKPGLDGHSNGAEQIARARPRRRLRGGLPGHPAHARADRRGRGARRTSHVVGLSVSSGSHLSVVPAVVAGLRAAGAVDVPVVVGGIIPPEDADSLLEQGVAAVFTPKDYRLTEMLDAVVTLVRKARRTRPLISGSLSIGSLRGSY